MSTIEQNIPESADLLAEIRGALADGLESAASFRDGVAERYPEDLRNARSAHELRQLADELRSNDIYDDTPALRNLLRLVTEHDLDDLACILPTDTTSGFNVSQYRFHNENESDDDYLSRLADALEEELRDGGA